MEIKEILRLFQLVCPSIQWDRYIENDDEYTYYGWINRKDGLTDFLVINFDKQITSMADIWFCTSSAKYSKQFAKLTESEHSDCIKVKI